MRYLLSFLIVAAITAQQAVTVQVNSGSNVATVMMSQSTPTSPVAWQVAANGVSKSGHTWSAATVFKELLGPLYPQMLTAIVGGGATCATPAGTTFTEGFEGGTGYDYPWLVGAGAVHSVVSSPGTPAANTACGHSLQMSPVAEVDYIYTTGSFPRIPTGTSFDATFTLYVSANSIASGNSKVLLAFSTGSGPVSVKFSQSGATLRLMCQGGTSSSAVSISLNAWHSVVVHVDATAANSYFTVDGGAQQTFTASANPATAVVVGNATGDTAAMTYAIGNIKIDSSVGGGPPPSLIMDSYGATDTATVTTTLLNGASHCGNGLWTGTVSTMIFSTTNAQSLRNPVTSCGVSYAGDVGLTIRHDLNSTNQATYTFTTASTAAAIGFYYQSSALVTDNLQYDIAAIQANPSGSVFIETAGSGSQRWFRMEVTGTGTLYYCDTSGNACSSTTVSTIPYAANTLYWITMGYAVGGSVQVNVYNAGTWALVGSASGPTQTANPLKTLSIGKVGGSSYASPSTYYQWYQNLVVDYRDGTFPVLP